MAACWRHEYNQWVGGEAGVIQSWWQQSGKWRQIPQSERRGKHTLCTVETANLVFANSKWQNLGKASIRISSSSISNSRTPQLQGFLRSELSLAPWVTLKNLSCYPPLNISGIRQFWICHCTLGAGNIFQDKVASELFVQFFVHLLLSTIGSTEKAQFVRRQQKKTVSIAWQLREMVLFLQKIDFPENINDGTDCADSMTVMAFLLQSMNTWW